MAGSSPGHRHFKTCDTFQIKKKKQRCRRDSLRGFDRRPTIDM